ncbi:hypothetical protein CQ045_09550 [Microbacterium sp. MYb66]|nr:hypothetical protein CQ045_09550 [Microbacterium sp. MYb66]
MLRRAGRTDVLHPGHPDFPAVPLGALDLQWMPAVGRAGFIVVTRDRRIRTRPAELTAYREHGIRSVWLGVKRDMRPDEQAQLFLRHEDRLKREIIKRGAGPWALAMNGRGLRPIRLGGE